MRTLSTHELRRQCTDFDNNGFVVAPDVLTPDELNALREHVDGAMSGELKPQPPHWKQPMDDFNIQWEPRVRNDPAVSRRDKIRIIFHLMHSHTFFWGLATNPRMLDLVENLIGPDIKLYTDQMFCKPAKHGSEVPWHQDSGYWPMAEPKLLSCWVAIDDVTVENGCVRFLPGTHKAAVPHHVVVTDNPNNLAARPEYCDPFREVPVTMKAGSICFHHSLTLHRSLPNESDKARRGLVMIYLPANLKFLSPWDFQFGFPLVRGHEAAMA
jgi:phytanoyl-CoA hydroxylase